ncbi:MAG TPA: caspase family protein [Longimicrobium sp.]|nr:caspase family protein [Longimicrobium sp.]
MPRPFRQLTLAQFAAELAAFRFTRTVKEVHMHHTWKPRKSDYTGVGTIEGMWRFHTRNNGWSDIAQHLSIAPDGTVWTGRDWNKTPASATGHSAGSFMFETIGNFDVGQEKLEGKQRQAVIDVIARVQLKFGLPVESLRFHRQFTNEKTCPGNGIPRAEILEEVRRRREQLTGGRGFVAGGAFVEADGGVPASSRTRSVLAADGAGAGLPPSSRERPFADSELDTSYASPGAAYEDGYGGGFDADGAGYNGANGDGHDGARGDDDAYAYAGGDGPARGDAYVDEGADEGEPECGTGAGGYGGARGPGSFDDFDPSLGVAARGGLTAAELEALRPHVVNLRQGRFSEGGAMDTSDADVDQMFAGPLRRALDEARGRGEPLRVVFYAHGGLVSEARGLRYAHDVAAWWKQNRVYPIFFVWETGLWDTLAQLLKGRRGLERGISDVSDRILEETARAAGGPKIWGGMKYSAERSVGSDGGARYVARKLADFVAAAGHPVELHAVGHSAGAIFHSWFIPEALNAGVAGFRTVSLLAPAIRADAFLERFGPLLDGGAQVESLTVFTMTRSFELRDHCGHVYRKSLLYLIHHALEPRREDPLLGLETSVRADPRLRALLGLEDAGSPHQVVWCPTEEASGRSASRSTSHGGFDNDRATMGSVMRRVLGASDTASIVPFPGNVSRELVFAGDDASADFDGVGFDADPVESWEAPSPAYTENGANGGSTVEAPAVHVESRSGGRKLALCVGIDRYPGPARLNGCVNDARLWARRLGELGFRTRMLLDGQATEAGITSALTDLVRAGRRGDVLVFQFAGHGTFFDDLGGDEKDRKDEAVVPVDFQAGRFLLDDEQFALYQQLAEGAALTSFYDCCHSGSMARVFIDAMLRAPADADLRPRFIDPTPEMVAEYRRRRADGRAGRGLRALRDPESLNAAVFSACRDDELAMEQNGQGVFTGHATRMLRAAFARGVTNQAFHRQIEAAFSAAGTQHPGLDGSTAARGRVLLRPLGGASPSRPVPGPSAEILDLDKGTIGQLVDRINQMPPEQMRRVLRDVLSGVYEED